MNVLFLGDVYGKPGREVLLRNLPDILKEKAIDFCIINGENLADGRGLTEKTSKPLFEIGVDVITGGNHLWDRAESLDFIQRCERIVKPMNCSPHAPGNNFYTCVKNDLKLTVACLSGQIFMPPADSPFVVFDSVYDQLKQETRCIVVDFHAESTAEKRALGWYLDGRVSALIGTHTHIQTADEEILPNGMAYLTDAGMTGPHDSVIGVKKKIIIDKMRSAIPQRYEVSDRGLQINGALIELDNDTGNALSISRLRITKGL